MPERRGSRSAAFRFGIDARLAGTRHAGIGRYTEELLRRFLKHEEQNAPDREIHWVLFVTPNHELSWLTEWQAQDPQRRTLHEVSVRHYTIAEQLVWWRVLERARLDLLYVPHFNVPWLYRKPFVMTLHDLLWHERRDARATTLSPWVHSLKYLAYRLVSGSAVRRAKAVFVPTEWVKKEVAKRIGREKRVWVTSEGIPAAYRRLTLPSSWPRLEHAHPYVVYVGSLYPHKNVETILRALRLLPNFRLKVIGSRSVFTDHLKKTAERFRVSSQVEWCGARSDAELVKDLQGAVALIQPSQSEGFGLTGLEAMAVGVPVIVSDIPVFTEVYGSAAKKFLPLDALSLSKLIQETWQHPPTESERQRLRRYALGFDWEEVAGRTWKVVREWMRQPW